MEWKGEGSVDWKEVIGLARKQGVLAIALDTLEKVPAELRPSKNILLEWFGRVNTMEQVYELYVNTIKDLGRLIGRNGLYMMVMKGYGISRTRKEWIMLLLGNIRSIMRICIYTDDISRRSYFVLIGICNKSYFITLHP